jgi:hypothetical protein
MKLRSDVGAAGIGPRFSDAPAGTPVRLLFGAV